MKISRRLFRNRPTCYNDNDGTHDDSSDDNDNNNDNDDDDDDNSTYDDQNYLANYFDDDEQLVRDMKISRRLARNQPTCYNDND